MSTTHPTPPDPGESPPEEKNSGGFDLAGGTAYLGRTVFLLDPRTDEGRNTERFDSLREEGQRQAESLHAAHEGLVQCRTNDRDPATEDFVRASVNDCTPLIDLARMMQRLVSAAETFNVRQARIASAAPPAATTPATPGTTPPSGTASRAAVNPSPVFEEAFWTTQHPELGNVTGDEYAGAMAPYLSRIEDLAREDRWTDRGDVRNRLRSLYEKLDAAMAPRSNRITLSLQDTRRVLEQVEGLRDTMRTERARAEKSLTEPRDTAHQPSNPSEFREWRGREVSKKEWTGVLGVLHAIEESPLWKAQIEPGQPTVAEQAKALKKVIGDRITLIGATNVQLQPLKEAVLDKLEQLEQRMHHQLSLPLPEGANIERGSEQYERSWFYHRIKAATVWALIGVLGGTTAYWLNSGPARGPNGMVLPAEGEPVQLGKGIRIRASADGRILISVPAGMKAADVEKLFFLVGPPDGKEMQMTAPAQRTEQEWVITIPDDLKTPEGVQVQLYGPSETMAGSSAELGRGIVKIPGLSPAHTSATEAITITRNCSVKVLNGTSLVFTLDPSTTNENFAQKYFIIVNPKDAKDSARLVTPVRTADGWRVDLTPEEMKAGTVEVTVSQPDTNKGGAMATVADHTPVPLK